MGAVNFTSLKSGDNVFWGSKRVFVKDKVASLAPGSPAAPGTLFTGPLGGAGLQKLATDVIYVGPDVSGDQAGVITVDTKATGGVAGFKLSRYSAATGM
jgi:hypothetical protein